MTRKRISWWLLFYLVVIIGLHILPFDVADLSEIKLGPLRLDHLLHAAMFLPWMAVVMVYQEGNKFRRSKMIVLLWLIAGVVFSAGTELIHYWLPYRVFNFSDLMFNVLGVVLGGLMVLGMSVRR